MPTFRVIIEGTTLPGFVPDDVRDAPSTLAKIEATSRAVMMEIEQIFLRVTSGEAPGSAAGQRIADRGNVECGP